MDGSVEQVGGKYVLRFERRLNHPVEKVWATLTEPEQLEKWLAEADLDLIEGGSIELRWQNTDEHGNSAVARGEITRLEPPRLLEYDTDIHGLLRWELRDDGDGCILTFTSTVEAPEDRLPDLLAGWHSHLDFLANTLEGYRVDWSNWPVDHWAEQRDRYTQSLGQNQRYTDTAPGGRRLFSIRRLHRLRNRPPSRPRTG